MTPLSDLPHAAEYTDAHGAPAFVALPPILALDIDGVCNSDATLRASRTAAVERALITRHLTPAAMLDALDPAMCARVQRVLSAAGAGYVLISTWCDLYARPDGDEYAADYPARCDTSRAEHIMAIIASLRARGITAECYGWMPEEVRKMSSTGVGHRRHAFAAWLDARPSVTRWCVLDDTVDHYGYRRSVNGAVRYHDPRFNGRCVHPVDGITEADADAAVAILTGGAL